MDAADFRRLALRLPGAEESSHMGSPDFRIGGRIFATLASQAQGFGNLVLTPELQAEFVAVAPEIFLPISGGWGRMGMTHVRLTACNEELLAGALRQAWDLRVKKNETTATAKRSSVGSKRDRRSGAQAKTPRGPGAKVASSRRKS